MNQEPQEGLLDAMANSMTHWEAQRQSALLKRRAETVGGWTGQPPNSAVARDRAQSGSYFRSQSARPLSRQQRPSSSIPSETLDEMLEACDLVGRIEDVIAQEGIETAEDLDLYSFAELVECGMKPAIIKRIKAHRQQRMRPRTGYSRAGSAAGGGG